MSGLSPSDEGWQVHHARQQAVMRAYLRDELDRERMFATLERDHGAAAVESLRTLIAEQPRAVEDREVPLTGRGVVRLTCPDCGRRGLRVNAATNLHASAHVWCRECRRWTWWVTWTAGDGTGTFTVAKYMPVAPPLLPNPFLAVVR